MNQPFIKYLGEKLKTGSLRSIHLNALPNRYLTRLDITKLDLEFQLNQKKQKKIKQPSAHFLFDLLLKKEAFQYVFKLDSSSFQKELKEHYNKYRFIDRRLSAMYNQAEDNFLEHGVETFSFGYPFLIKRSKTDRNRIIKAPIFIWSLDLERSKNNCDKWIISKTADAPIYINQVLISHIAQDEGIKMSKLHPDYLDDNLLDRLELSEIVSEIINEFRTYKNKIRPTLEPCPSAATLNEKADKPFIQWSGVFGLFKTQKQSIIQDIEVLITNYDDTPLPITPFKQSKHTAVQTDPSQQEIIHSIYNSEYKIIQGPPGTGKSQSLTAIITNGLENLKKILVVCEKKTALEVIENNLKSLGLDEICITIDDVNRDRRKVIDAVRKRSDIAFLIDENFEDVNYNYIVNRFEQLSERYNQKHHHLLKPVLTGKNFKQLIGQFIKLKHQGYELENLFKDISFTFTDNEYQELSMFVREGKNLFRAVHERHFDFDKFLKTRFLEQYSVTVEQNLFEDIEKVEDIVHQFLDSWESLTFAETKKAENFSRNNQRWTKVKALFSSSNRMVVRHWKNTKVLFEQLKLNLESNKLISFDLKWDEETQDLSPIRDAIKDINWLLSSVIQLKPRFRAYYLWRHFFEQRYKVYQKVIHVLRLQVPNAKDWANVFELEYIHCFLEHHDDLETQFNIDDRELEEIQRLEENIRNTQKDKILTYWLDIRYKAIRRYNDKSNLNWLYNYRRNTLYTKANSLRKIVHEDFDLFTSIFPVVLVNPTVCSSIFPLEKGIFDLVIFDEASQLRLEETFTAFYRGKTKVISGDKQQMPPSSYFATDISLNAFDDIAEEETITATTSLEKQHPLFLAESESLLAFGNNLNENNTHVSYLDFHYRSKHPHLIDFSNAAFYGKRLVPLPPKEDYQAIHLINVNGLYKDAHNLDEAEKIMEIIQNEIYPDENGTYPTLGIATFNLKQRNIIKDLIYKKGLMDHNFRGKLEYIGKKEDWFIKNLENVQGDERDIIIISTTFGVNGNGRFIQNFGPINNYEKGYKLLNVIITRAKKKLYIVISIPEEKYTSYQTELQEKGNKGKAIFYAYLDYCKAVQEQNEPHRQKILRTISRNNSGLEHYKTPLETNIFPFEQMVYKYLCQYISAKHIEQNYTLGGYQLDLVIKDENEKPFLVIECDGTDWHKTNEAYIYDIHRQKIIEDFGLKYIRTWVRNWWPAPDQEAMRIIHLLQDHTSSSIID